jgi:hypothetical protein
MWQRAPFAASLPKLSRLNRESDVPARSPPLWRGDRGSNSSALTTNSVLDQAHLDLGALEYGNTQIPNWDLPGMRLTSTTLHAEEDYSEMNSKVPTNTPTASAKPSSESEGRFSSSNSYR